MDVTRCKTRLVCDPSISAASYQKIMEDYMTSKGSRHLQQLLQEMATLTWKQAPRLALMLDFADLYKAFFKENPNTILSHAKLAAAIRGHHTENPCIFSSKGVVVTCNKISTK